MAKFVEFDIVTDEDALLAIFTEAMEAQFPGWVSAPGSYEEWLARIWARIASETAELAADVPPEIFAQFGTKILNLPPVAPNAASVLTNWTARDSAGYTIPANTLVSIQKTGSDLIGFQTTEDVFILPGSTTVNNVRVEAAEPGAYANDATGPVALLDALTFIESITIVGSTANGSDAEDPDAYLNRLREELRLLSPRPILPVDAETLARRVPGVARALALDLYDPSDGLYNHERTVTVAITDAAGEELDSDVKDAVQALLELHREINFVFNVIDASYSTIKVRFTVVPLPGFSQATVNASVTAAITAYLQPSAWGIGPFTDDRAQWVRSDSVYINELISLADRVVGVDRVTTMEAAKGANAYGTATIALDQPAALTRPGAIGPI